MIRSMCPEVRDAAPDLAAAGGVVPGGGWRWQATRMTDPDHAARLWLVSIGGEADAVPPPGTIAALPDPPARTRRTSRPRIAFGPFLNRRAGS